MEESKLHHFKPLYLHKHHEQLFPFCYWWVLTEPDCFSTLLLNTRTILCRFCYSSFLSFFPKTPLILPFLPGRHMQCDGIGVQIVLEALTFNSYLLQLCHFCY